MKSDSLKCLRCGEAMVEGYLLPTAKDIFGSEIASHIVKWFAGKGEVTGWRIRPPSDAEEHLVSAHRCPACGHLELMAP